MKRYSLILFTFLSVFLQAQNHFELAYHLPQNIEYNASIPTPESIIGHSVGEYHVTHDKLVLYMKTLAKASPRITVEDRGKTFEGRPLLLLTITASENHATIENIRIDHLKLTESSNSGQIDVASMPLVVYMGFSIHGNEASGANASILLAYYLAAAEGPEIEALLSNTVILLDPSLNPDGLQRFAYWANTNKSNTINPDPNDREFHEVWPGGRTNHYWFDLNRDWLPVQLPESKARIESFHKWMPNILTDHHEMGSNTTFFFQPGIPSRVHPLTPKLNQELTKEIGNYHIKALDNLGSLYFSEENFDDFYYGKGSTYPDVNGGIGILFEQGSSRGHAQETVNGILTFPFAIRNQFTVALSTLSAAKDMRVKLLNYQRNFYINAKKEASKDAIKAIVFGDKKDASKPFHLAEILYRHKIKVHKPSSDISVNGIIFKKENSYIVPTDQKNSKLIKAMFEKRTAFVDSLFYDISAWTFPLAFNLDYAELKTTSNIGSIITNLIPKRGEVKFKSNYAYLMKWHNYYAPKALDAILKKGIRAKVGMKQFSLEGTSYDYGTILIPVQNQDLNEDELYAVLQEIAANSNITLFGVKTGITTGIDLGSNQFKILDKPKVALLVGKGISSYDAGEIWHLFDQRYQMNITKLDVSYLSSVDISKYTTIIIPSLSTGSNATMLKKLKPWVENGGILIAYKNAIKWLSNNKLIDLDYATVNVSTKNVTFEQKNNFFGAQNIGGAIFETVLDRSHPINFGYSRNNLPIFRQTKLFIKPDSISYNNPIKYTNNPLLSGYISKPNLEVLKNTVPFQAKQLGSGGVIVFTDNTNFRAFWYGTNKLLMNAVFFGKEM